MPYHFLTISWHPLPPRSLFYQKAFKRVVGVLFCFWRGLRSSRAFKGIMGIREELQEHSGTPWNAPETSRSFWETPWHSPETSRNALETSRYPLKPSGTSWISLETSLGPLNFLRHPQTPRRTPPYNFRYPLKLTWDLLKLKYLCDSPGTPWNLSVAKIHLIYMNSNQEMTKHFCF